jgi:hypothetical protein
MPKKTEHVRLGCENFSKISELSYGGGDDELMDMSSRNAGSEHSNDTEVNDLRDSTAVYDEYREIFKEYRVNEKDQQYIFKSFENKTDKDIDLFVQ